MSAPFLPPMPKNILNKPGTKWTTLEKEFVAYYAKEGENAEQIQQKLNWRTTRANTAQMTKISSNNKKQEQIRQQLVLNALAFVRERKRKIFSSKGIYLICYFN